MLTAGETIPVEKGGEKCSFGPEQILAYFPSDYHSQVEVEFSPWPGLKMPKNLSHCLSKQCCCI